MAMKAPRVHAPTPAHPGWRCPAVTCVRASDGDAPRDQRVPRESSHLLLWGDPVREFTAVCSHGPVTSFIQEILFTARHFCRSVTSFIRGCASGTGLLAAAGHGGVAGGKAGCRAFLGLMTSRKGWPERRSPVLAQHRPFVSWSLPRVRAAGWPKSAEMGQGQGLFL